MTGGTDALLELRVAGSPDEVRAARRRIRELGAELGLSATRCDGLAVAAAEATTNAVAHGNAGNPCLPAEVRAHLEAGALVVAVRDHGSGYGRATDVPVPDVHAKLRGEQDARGWGIFLMHRLVDEVRTAVDEDGHVVELVVRLPGVGS